MVTQRGMDSIQVETESEQTRKTYTLQQWLALKKDFILGKGRLIDLCQKHGINYATATTKSSREKWERKRQAWLDRRNAALNELGPDGSEPKPEPITGPVEDKAETLRRQIRMVDEAIFAAMSAKDIADLAKAKQLLTEQLFVLEHGMKPGTMKPTRQRSRGSSVDVQPIAPIPQPVGLEPQAGDAGATHDSQPIDSQANSPT